MKDSHQSTLERRLRALVRRVAQEKSLGAMSAGKARRALASDFLQVQRHGYGLPVRLLQAARAALNSPVRTFSRRTTWISDLAIYQPLSVVEAPASLEMPQLLQGFSQRQWFQAA